MAEDGTLEALKALHRDLLVVVESLKEDREGRGVQLLAGVPSDPSLNLVAPSFKNLLKKPARKKESRDTVLSGKVQVSGEEWSLNKDFQEIALQVADELDLDEVQAAQLVLEAEEYESELGRPRRDCAIIRFHQQRQFLLSCIRLLLELATAEDDLEADGIDGLGGLSPLVDHIVLREPPPGGAAPAQSDRFVPACTDTMRDVRDWLARHSNNVATASVVGRAADLQAQETAEFTRISLIRQHELLSVVLGFAVERNKAMKSDFVAFLQALRKVDKYDFSVVHQFAVLGAYITTFGSTEGSGSVDQARELNALVCQQQDEDPKRLVFMNAAIQAWWIAEYSGWYMEGAAGDGLPNVDINAEDGERSRIFSEALRDGAFDFLFALVADAKTSEWQDPARSDLRRWLQNRTPSLPADTVAFSDFFQSRLTEKLETFVDAFISNLPNYLRKLRSEEDEQRQMRQVPDQDLDLERFLLVIAYSYEGRPDAAENFWSDPESNLAGFLHWASRRASTPLVTAFCEMLQCLSEDEESARSAHEFLLDEGHHSSGKMRRALSLTWSQILREMEFFAEKIREKPAPTQANTPRGTKPSSDFAETEPESSMMLECYLRLMAKLASGSEDARYYLWNLRNPRGDGRVIELLFQLVSSLVTPRLRACAFRALAALIDRNSVEGQWDMWFHLEACLTGHYIPASSNRAPAANSLPPSFYMEALFETMSPHFDEASAFIQFLVELTSLPGGGGVLHDQLPFPENLGATSRMRPGIEPYVDFTLGHMFASRVSEAQDITQQRMLRFSCLDFALTCISSFNEDLLVFSSETSIPVDAATSAKDLATYVSLHPFARVMEWMFDSKFMKSLLDTMHQDSSEIGRAAPDSPMMLGVLRAVQLISKALDLQATFIDLVRPIVRPHGKPQSRSAYSPVSNSVYASVEDGLLTSMTLISDLGGYCGLGNAELTLASLKLLERISSSSRVVAVWDSTPQGQSRRNKAIVALEEYGDNDIIAGSFIAEFSTPLDPYRQAESPSYLIKSYILDFIYYCLLANPDRPTIAHLLLGFHCSSSTLSIDPDSAFGQRSSLFHSLLPLIVEMPCQTDEGMQTWLINLKYKVMRIFKILWSSRLSSSLVLDELRDHDFLFHLLLQGLVVAPQDVAWDGQAPNSLEFLNTPAAEGFLQYLAMRSMAMGYITHELCSVSQGNMPAIKRRIFEALGGQVRGDGGEPMTVPSVFQFHDSLPQDEDLVRPPPTLTFFRNVDLRSCLEEDDASNPVYNLAKVEEVVALKTRESAPAGQLVRQEDSDKLDEEQLQLCSYVVYLNRVTQTKTYSLQLLKAWTKLVLVMTDVNDFKGTTQVSFILQTLQAILPNLETYSSDRPDAAFELAQLAKVLIFKLDFSTMTSADKQGRAIESLVSDKLFQLFQICLSAVAKWTGKPELRALYYGICYRYLTALIDHGHGALSGRRKTTRTVQAFGDKLANVICDDAFGGDPGCQAAALILLSTLVHLGSQENDNFVVESLNRLNFIGIVVDSLRNVMQEWIEINSAGDPELQYYHNAKLALLLQLCQTREGAKNVLHANLFTAIGHSGLFAVDPELQVDSSDARAMEKHYTLLVKVTRIIGAAIVSRGSHNLPQGRRFLTEHRMLVMHVLKRSAGIGASGSKLDRALAERVDELAEAFMVIIMATGFLEFENESVAEDPAVAPALFH